jgi:hypothetical protein
MNPVVGTIWDIGTVIIIKELRSDRLLAMSISIF